MYMVLYASHTSWGLTGHATIAQGRCAIRKFHPDGPSVDPCPNPCNGVSGECLLNSSDTPNAVTI
eukprot:scaffold68115_cov70-Attheya_sp.AAC.2